MKFNRSINVLGYSDHDIGSKDKEYVIEEEQSKENCSIFEVSQEDILKRMNAEDYSQDVVIDPTLANHIDCSLD